MGPLIETFYLQFLAFLPLAASGLLIFIGFWIGAKITETVILKAGKRSRVDASLIELLGNSAQVAIVIFGAVTALGTMGVNVGALIAGLGLSSFALGFALKDALSNFMAGISILFYRPFVIGDRIETAGFQGTVSSINLLYTVLSLEGIGVLIPNANLFTNPVVVLSRQS